MKDNVSPEAAARIAAVLAQTQWETDYPKFAERLVAYREAKERVTQRVLTDLAAAKTRQEDREAQEAQALLAKWTGRGRYDQ